MSYAPFGFMVPRPFRNITPPPPTFDDPILVNIAEKYGKSTKQVVIRYLVRFSFLFFTLYIYFSSQSVFSVLSSVCVFIFIIFCKTHTPLTLYDPISINEQNVYFEMFICNFCSRSIAVQYLSHNPLTPLILQKTLTFSILVLQMRKFT